MEKNDECLPLDGKLVVEMQSYCMGMYLQSTAA